MPLRWIVALPLLVPACFHPSYDHPRCGPSGECPSGLACSAQQVCEADPSGAPTDAPDNGPSDTLDAPSGICIGRFVLVCRPAVPPNLAFLAPATINTDVDSRCTLQGQGPGVPELCVMAGDDIKVDAQITVIGSHPLVLAAYHDLVITSKGQLVLTSPSGMPPGAGANDPACHAPTTGGNGTAGSGGGAGGSFGGSGGVGGTGDTGGATAGTPGAPITPIDRVIGGCKGSPGGNAGLLLGGTPGHGGGAVMLIADNKLTLSGLVTAGGGGGLPAILAGGGGGGSGGFVGLEARSYTIFGTGQVTANGGGGASGGATALVGTPGNDGTSSTTIAAAGGGAVASGGGGSGSIAPQPNGAPGQNAVAGGGGGGGGAGVILVKGAAPVGGSYSPPLTIVP